MSKAGKELERFTQRLKGFVMLPIIWIIPVSQDHERTVVSVEAAVESVVSELDSIALFKAQH